MTSIKRQIARYRDELLGTTFLLSLFCFCSVIYGIWLGSTQRQHMTTNQERMIRRDSLADKRQEKIANETAQSLQKRLDSINAAKK